MVDHNQNSHPAWSVKIAFNYTLTQWNVREFFQSFTYSWQPCYTHLGCHNAKWDTTTFNKSMYRNFFKNTSLCICNYLMEQLCRQRFYFCGHSWTFSNTELTKCSVFLLQGWQHFKDGAKEILYSMELWRSHLKLIHGQCIDVD